MHVSVGFLYFLYLRWTKSLNLVELLVTGTRTWSFHFVVSKYLDYTHYYMILLEQYGHIVVKDLATVIWLDRTKFMFARWRDWITLLPLRKNLLPSIFNSVDFWNSMSLIVLDVELTDKNVIKEMGLYIEGLLQEVSFCPPKTFINLINRQHGTQVVYMELRGVVESWIVRSCLLYFTTWK